MFLGNKRGNPFNARRETLTGKYGEDSKLIYDLADQGGELLSLRCAWGGAARLQVQAGAKNAGVVRERGGADKASLLLLANILWSKSHDQ